MRFSGKVALITGGGTGIGAAVARRIAADGGNVVLVGRRAEPLHAVAKAIDGHVIAADASDGPAMKRAVALVKERYGGLDILVASAGGFGGGRTHAISDEDWATARKLNLDTLFVSARESLPELMARKGNIVVVASVGALSSGPDAAGYITMKHAALGLAKSLARDYGRRGVRTNTVCPGFVSTPMAEDQMRFLMEMRGLKSIEEAYAVATSDVPLGRAATPDEVANVICFLASAEAAMVNGAEVTVDGGESIVHLSSLAFIEESYYSQ